jgi:hypothetical protein
MNAGFKSQSFNVGSVPGQDALNIVRIRPFCHKTKDMNHSPQTGDPDRLAAALARFDEANSGDPNHELDSGKQLPRELVYAERVTRWVLRLKPDASEALRLAARGAHLRRWEIPRTRYPATRPGYLRWRADLKKFHAEKVAEIMAQIGYPEEIIFRVNGLVSKAAFPQDPDSRTLEDALCLVFLENQFADLLARSGEAKVIGAVQKSWHKMTSAGRTAALELQYAPHVKAVLEKALNPDSRLAQE